MDTDSDNLMFAGEALVLYFDLQGVSSLFSHSEKHAARVANIEKLARLFEALDPVRNLIGIPKQNGVQIPDTLAAAMFSDSVFSVAAVSENGPSDSEGILAGQLSVCSQCQTSLLHQDFVCRGAITEGLVAVDGNFISGPACSKVAAFDKHGNPPVVFVDKDLILSSYRKSCAAKCSSVNRSFFLFEQNWRYKLLYDTDVDEFFFNYMSEWYEACDDSGEREECYKELEKNLTVQKSVIESKLNEYVAKGGLRTEDELCRKFCYLANYHNFVIRLYAERERFKTTAKHVVVLGRDCLLPPAKIAVSDHYLRKLVIEQAYSQGRQNVDADFYSDSPPVGDIL